MTETITKTTLVPAKNAKGADTMRLSDEDLHRAARKGLHGAEHEVFGLLPATMRQIIDNKVWRAYQHKDFASYALDATSNGLGVNTNQRLWILRCSMDVQHYDKAIEKMVPGEHIKEWSDVLARIEDMVRIEAKASGLTIGSFGGNSLETLAKNDHSPMDEGKITYLPSGQFGGGADGVLIRLRRNRPELHKRVVSGGLSLVDARREARMAGVPPTGIGRAKSLVRNMTPKERREFFEWAKVEGYL
jgi:hypothetical protein